MPCFLFLLHTVIEANTWLWEAFSHTYTHAHTYTHTHTTQTHTHIHVHTHTPGFIPSYRPADPKALWVSELCSLSKNTLQGVRRIHLGRKLEMYKFDRME